MSYQSISHARSHRTPFHGLGNAPSDPTRYARVAAMEAARKVMAAVAAQPQAARAAIIQAALEQIRPGLFQKVERIAASVVAQGGAPAIAYEEALRKALEAEYKNVPGDQLSGCAGCGGMGANLEWIGTSATAVANIAGIISGAPKQAERAAASNARAAASNAAAAGTNAAAQVEIARIQAETARLQAGQQSGSKTPIIIAAVVSGLALLGVLGFVVLKK